MSIELLADRDLVSRHGGSCRHVKVGLIAPDRPEGAARRPLNLAFVLDRSGSMQGGKLSLARAAVLQALDLLRPEDQFSVVVYDDVVDVAVPRAPATPDARASAAGLLDAVAARGSTDLCGGFLHGCGQVASGLDREQVARCLLLTDGLANHGETHPLVIQEHARQLRRRGVGTSTFGVGEDYAEPLLRGMADGGGGNAYHVEGEAQIAPLLRAELAEAMDVVARDVWLHVTTSAAADLVGGQLVERTGDGIRVFLGDVVARQALALLVAVRFPAGERAREVPVRFTLSDRDGLMTDGGALSFRYAGGRENEAQPRRVEVDRLAARRYADLAVADAVALNRLGRFRESAARLRKVAERVRGYAGTDAELLALVAELESRAEVFSRIMPEMLRKQTYQVATTGLRSKHELGVALRKGGG